MARPHCFMFAAQRMPLALPLALLRAGSSRLARMAMMAIATSSSIKVKPRLVAGRYKAGGRRFAELALGGCQVAGKALAVWCNVAPNRLSAKGAKL